MAMETSVILRAVLYRAMKAKSIQEAIDEIMVMCTQEDIAIVKQCLAEEKAREEKE